MSTASDPHGDVAHALDPAFVALLEARREYWNALARRARGLDDARFLAHLRGPVCAAVLAAPEDERAAVLESLYTLSLRAHRKRLLGEGAGASPGLSRVFSHTLPLLTPHIAPDIARVAPALGNAALLVEERIGDAGPWLAHLEGRCRAAEPGGEASHRLDADALLDVGLVLAWRLGVAELRDAAIDRFAKLPRELQAELFPTSAIAAAPTDRFRAPGETGLTNPRILYRLGGHTSLGGSFIEPPLVAAHGGHLYAYDSQRTMRVFADAFGACLRRAHVDPTAPESPLPNGVALRSGRLTWPGASPVTLPELKKTSSAAYCDGAMAVTVPHSHHVFIVGCAAGPA